MKDRRIKATTRSKNRTTADNWFKNYIEYHTKKRDFCVIFSVLKSKNVYQTAVDLKLILKCV